MTQPLPTLEDVRTAAARIEPHIHRTPVVRSRTLDERIGAEIHMKAENLQKIGAFKARGATNAILALDDDDLERGVATHSSGNHGQAVAYAASIVGTQATIVVPDHASKVKIDAIAGYGADIVMCAQAEREQRLAEVVSSTGATVVHPFDDPDVVAGQGTATLELLDQVSDLDVVIAPIGGGGLLAGATIVANAAGVPTVGAEPEVVDDAQRSLRDGVRHPATGAPSVGDGLLTGIGQIPFEVLIAGQTSIVTASEQQILDAMRYVVERTKLVVEPSAATVFAAMFTHPDLVAGKRVGAIISGGNVELTKLAGV